MKKKFNKEKKKMKKHQRVCPHCKGIMKFRGAGNATGGSYWKCKNKRCGRTHWKHPIPMPPIEIKIETLERKAYG